MKSSWDWVEEVIEASKDKSSTVVDVIEEIQYEEKQQVLDAIENWINNNVGEKGLTDLLFELKRMR